MSKEIRNFRQSFKYMAKLLFRSYDPNQIVLFPQRIDEDIPGDSPVRIVSKVVDNLNLTAFHKLYHGVGRCAYHPRMMLKVIIYAYMNNIYSCRKIAEALQRDIHFIWLAGREKPDYITINRFRNRVKDEISNIFTQLVLLLAAKGLVSLDVEYVDGTKIESKANKYTFVWRKSVEKNRANLMEKIKNLLSQIDEVAAQDKVKSEEKVEFTPAELTSLTEELNTALSQLPNTKDNEEKKKRKEKQKQLKELKEHTNKLEEYNTKLDILGERNSYSKTDPDATFMHMKEDSMQSSVTKPGYNLQIAAYNQFITNFALFPNPTDTLTYIPFMKLFKERYGYYPSIEVADAGYGSQENYQFIEENKATAYVKYNHFYSEQRANYVPDPFRPQAFIYDEKGNYCTCPNGQRMEYIGRKEKKTGSGYTTYKSCFQSVSCEGCPLREQCIKGEGKGNKIIERNFQLEKYREKAYKLLTSEIGLKQQIRRNIEPEAIFGQMKYNMGYKRFRHVSKDKVNMDFAFFAIAFDLKKLIAKILKGGLERLFSYFSALKTFLNASANASVAFLAYFVHKSKKYCTLQIGVCGYFLGKRCAKNVFLGHFDTPPPHYCVSIGAGRAGLPTCLIIECRKH